MEINGREIKFLRTVKATSEIAKLAPNGDISRIGELFEGDLSTTLETSAKLIHFLNEGYETNRHFSDRTYKQQIISVEEIMSLDDATFKQLVEDMMKNIGNGTETFVEVEEPKKKENHEGVK